MRTYYRVLNLVIIATILSTFLPASLLHTSAQAAVMQSQMVTENGNVLSSRDVDEIKVKRAIENKLVQERLESAGLTKTEVIEKMDKMTDAEVHQIASLSDNIPSGGSAIGFVTGVLVIVVLALLIVFLVKKV